MGSDGKFYTQEQVRAVIAYARDRGIRVVPEFDVPAHTQSWFVGYPELASGPGPYTLARTMGVKDPVMDPTRPEVYAMLDGFFVEMAALFPDDYFHIGGDENNGRQWSRSPHIHAYMRAHNIADNAALQTAFNQRVAEILKKHGKKMVGWDEILQPGLPADTVVQSWRGARSLRESAKQGYRVILSSGYYLDHVLPAAEHYRVDPLPEENDLSKEEAARVLGGEACMWGEYVTPETIDSRTWPRTAAIAERLWSPASVRDVGDMYRRLEAVSARLTERGLTHETYVDPMLRRLAGTSAIEPLRTLVDVVEPVKNYNRGEAHPITTDTSLTFLVDAARPDSAVARRFAALVDGFLADAPRFRTNRDALQRVLTQWRDVRPAINGILTRSPRRREVEPLAAELSSMGTAGLEAVRFVSTGASAPPGWREAKRVLLEQAGRSKAEVEFAILPAMRRLVTAVR
jgi:hexosaminidase